MVNNFSTKEKVQLSQDEYLGQNNNDPIKEDGNSERTSRIKGIGEKLNLKERVDLTLNRKDYRSSLGLSSLSFALKEMRSMSTYRKEEKALDNNQSLDRKERKKDNGSVVEQDVEDNSIGYFKNQRIQLLESFCQHKIKRCISSDSWLLKGFPDIDLLYKTKEYRSFPNKTTMYVRKSDSCEMFPGLFYTQTTDKNPDLDHKNIAHSTKDCKPMEPRIEFMPQPLWISGRTVDTFRFLIQWLVVSLLDIPLVILELHASSHLKPNKVDDANKSTIAKICIEADKKGWTTGDLMAIISRECFQNTNESVEDCARRALYFHT